MITNTAYTTTAKFGNLVENWLFKFYYDAAGANDFIGLGTSDTVVSSVFYHGSILGVPRMRSSIDLAKSVASIDNMTLTVENIKWQGQDLWTEIKPGATHKYINRKVQVYSQLNAQGTLANCMQIGLYRLTDLSFNHNDNTIRIALASHRPWDFIKIPNVKTPEGNYFPVVYGDYQHETSTQASQQFCDSAVVWPSVVDKADTYLRCLLFDESGISNCRPHYYDSNLDIFIPLDPVNDTPAAYGDAYAVSWRNTDDDTIDLRRGFVYNDVSENVDNDWDNPDNVTDASNWASDSVSADYDTGLPYTDNKYLYLDAANPDGNITQLIVQFDYEIEITSVGNGVIEEYIQLLVGGAGSESPVDTRYGTDGVGTTSGSDNQETLTTDLIAGSMPILSFMARASVSGGGSGDSVTGTVRVRDLKIFIKQSLDTTETQSSNKELARLKTVYCGADGLTRSWTTGVVTEIHEAHRDMLHRYTGFSNGDLDSTSWSDIDTDRDWKIRYWASEEPEELKKILEMLQYEGGFIFRWRPDGTGGYVYVKESYASADVDLTYDDIYDLTEGHTPFSELLTKANINYQKHAATGKYGATVTVQDSTARTAWNINSAENIADVSLNAYVSPAINDTDTKPTDNWWVHYHNIFGDIKKMATVTLINPKHFGIETGDIVTLPMWAGVYCMVTSLDRQPGQITIECREVG